MSLTWLSQKFRKTIKDRLQRIQAAVQPIIPAVAGPVQLAMQKTADAHESDKKEYETKYDMTNYF
jgi:hypothetical protein